MDSKNWTDVVYLDFSKAFNSVPHNRLLWKLASLDIKGNFYHWIKDFLSERTEIVVVEDAKSKPCAMTSGVPQGSCLGPLLIIAFVNGIDDCLTFSI